jgi:hypothetical protein
LVRPVGFSGIEGKVGLRGMGLEGTDRPDVGKKNVPSQTSLPGSSCRGSRASDRPVRLVIPLDVHCPGPAMSEPFLLTLNEAADQTGLTVDALRKRIKRGRLRSFRGNDGLVRVRLNEEEMEELRADRPSSRPASPLAEESAVVRALEAHNVTLQEQLSKAEQRAERAQERAEKAEQRLIEELARLAGQNGGIQHQTELPGLAALVSERPEDEDFKEVLAELRLEFEGEGREYWPEQPASEPNRIEAASLEPNSEPRPATPLLQVPRSRRIWSRFLQSRRQPT